MRSSTEIPTEVLDASSPETTTPAASAATDADQSGEAASASTTTQPDSNEDSGTDSEEMHMESTPAPEAAQSQDQEHAPHATAVSLPAADNQGSSQAQIVKSEKKSTALTPKRSHKKKKANPLSRAQVADMAASEACPAATPSTFAFGGLGQTTGKRQFVRPLTDMGNAMMFAKLFSGLVLYVFEFGQFIVWDPCSKKWLREENGGCVALSRLTNSFLDARYAEARSDNYLYTVNDEALSQGEVLKWAKSSSQHSRIKAMLELVKFMENVCVFQSALDADKLKLGVDNGVLDLVTGALKENKPEYLITRYTRAASNPDAEAPAFMKYIHEVCMGRQDLVDFVQEVLGYALSGLTKERVFFILLGAGTNGKSTLVETFYHLMGDYARSMPSHAFIKSESRAIRNDLARLPGIRFAPCAEINTGKYLDESLVKRVTGNDVITARFIGKEFFDFHIIAKFFYSVNTLPRVVGADNGIYNRLVVLPFDGDFEKRKDGDLGEKLEAEIDGILAWAVTGFQRWHKRTKLVKPDCVIEASKAYRAEMDTVQSFLDDMCIRDENATTPLGPFFEAYQQWAKGALAQPANLHLFGTLMGQKGFKKVKSGSWRWKGVALKAAATATGPSVFGAPTAPSPTAPEPSTTGLTQ